ncbi:MAG TPA: GTP cyclohydrolase II [Jatrophihabitans sp.]|jgi:GTP cyclohydrolase II|nr:GTP cyclohydrolase II [Jatrophihabitans sp.]
MPARPPAATIRTQLTLPLRFADGYATTARVFSFDGLVDGREHLALGLGDRAAAPAPTGGSGSAPNGSAPNGSASNGSAPHGSGSKSSAPNGSGPNGSALNGSARTAEPPLVRPHSECLTGDVLGSQRCDCGPQLREAVERIAEHGGYLLYLRQEGRGIGLYAKLDAYALQDAGLDTYQANLALGYAEDERDYTVAAQMLQALGLDRIALLSNNPDKAAQLSRLGVTVTEQVPTGEHLSAANAGYLAAKARHAGHTLSAPQAQCLIG